MTISDLLGLWVIEGRWAQNANNWFFRKLPPAIGGCLPSIKPPKYKQTGLQPHNFPQKSRSVGHSIGWNILPKISLHRLIRATDLCGSVSPATSPWSFSTASSVIEASIQQPLPLEHCWKKQLLYFEWSPPWHVGWRLSGEGCHWEYDGKNGEFENIDFRFPWLSDTSEMGFGHDVPFLNYSDRLPHPSDLCQPDRVRWG